MLELFLDCIRVWQLYWNGGEWFFLLMVVGAVLLVVFGEKKVRNYLLSSSVLVLFLFFLPLTNWVLRKFGDDSVYWRVLWVFPGALVMAAGFTAFVRKCSKGWRQGVLVGLLLCGIVAAGTNVYCNGGYSWCHNMQQVPDCIVQAAEMIKADRGEETNALIAGCDDAASYLRVYDSSLHLLYGRGGRGTEDIKKKRMYHHVNNQNPIKAEIEAAYCRIYDVKYIIRRLERPERAGEYLTCGFRLLGEVDGLFVFRYE